jgi:hypothetical protein
MRIVSGLYISYRELNGHLRRLVLYMGKDIDRENHACVACLASRSAEPLDVEAAGKHNESHAGRESTAGRSVRDVTDSLPIHATRKHLSGRTSLSTAQLFPCERTARARSVWVIKARAPPRRARLTFPLP